MAWPHYFFYYVYILLQTFIHKIHTVHPPHHHQLYFSGKNLPDPRLYCRFELQIASRRTTNLSFAANNLAWYVWNSEAESKEKHNVWVPMPELTTTSPYVHSNTFTMGNLAYVCIVCTATTIIACKCLYRVGVVKSSDMDLSDSYPAFFLLIATTSNKNF